MDSLMQSIAGFPAFLLYFVLALILLAIFVAIYTRVTPYREIALIREETSPRRFRFQER